MHITCNAQKSSKDDRGKTQQWKTTEREIYWTDFQRESKPKHPKLHYDIDIFKIHAQHKAQIKKKKDKKNRNGNCWTAVIMKTVNEDP